MLSLLKNIPVKSHVALCVKHDLKIFSPSGRFLTICALEGVPGKELISGRSHFSFKFNFQSENELLFFSLELEKNTRTVQLLYKWNWVFPSLQPEMKLDS
jgi:hypothetical protein